MKEPQRIKLTDSPTNKTVKLTPLPSNKNYDIEPIEDICINNNENNQQNNSQSIPKLESEQTN